MPVAPSASTSHASVAPEKKVNPKPMNMDTPTQPHRGARTCHRAK